MKVLIIGGGGREHALAWKLAQSPRVKKVFCAPGNAGIAQVAECVAIDSADVPGLTAFAMDHAIDFTVVGPETPLCAGVVDSFERKGLKIFGPNQRAAQLEGSKIFCKNLLVKSGVPTAISEEFDDARSARDYLRHIGAPIVVKADGLAAGKGVVVANSIEQAEQAIADIMERKLFGAAGTRVIIEEFLAGEEASVMALTDGTTFEILAAAQDHKRVLDGDHGANTGGMGAYSPTPAITPALGPALDDIFSRTLKGLRAEGIEFRGVLYAGLMLTDNGPKVLEYNVRFGDPETQVVVPRMDFDLLEALERTAAGRLAGFQMNWKREATVCVVMAAGGYPGSYKKGLPISGLDEVARLSNVAVFHAGTRSDSSGRIVTDGGRVLGVTALGSTIVEAQKLAYAAVERIHFDEAHYRRDIAGRALARMPRTPDRISSATAL